MSKLKNISVARSVLSVLAISCCTVSAFAQTPNYSGDIWSRSTLTGDWGGVRNELAKKGITLDIYVAQTYQGVVSGGTSHTWQYGGRGEITLEVDTGKLGLWQGGLLTVEGEGNWGKDVNSKTGSLLPVNTNHLFPVPFQTASALSAVNFTQFFSPYFGVLVGKVDVTVADANEFAHGKYGKGATRFMNLAFNINPVVLLQVPYTPLIAGAVISPTGNPEDAIIKLLYITSNGKANAAGFDEIRSDAVTLYGEARVRTDFFGMTGHQLVGGAYTNKEFISTRQTINVGPGAVNSIAMKKGSWAVYWNFDQYLYEPVKGSGNGFGIFGRVGIGDGNPDFLHQFYSFGVGGKGVFASRPDDRFGVGYYYLKNKSPELDINLVIPGIPAVPSNPPVPGSPSLVIPLAEFQPLRDEWGFEAFYSFALTPWAHLTADIQVVRGALKTTFTLPPEPIKTSVTAGLRLGLQL